MARENVVDPELKSVKGATEDSKRGLRSFGDGLSGDIVAARLQGYNLTSLDYLDVLVDDSGNLITSGGGGGGGAVTIADGADVAQGARSDAAWSGSGNGTTISLLKALIAMMQALATRVDDVGGGISYVGKAVAGTTTSAALWQISRVTDSAGDVVVEFADGDNGYDNIWDNRASLSYS